MAGESAAYDVVWPLGKASFEELPVNSRTADLSNKKVAFLWDWLFRGDEMFPAIQDELSKRFPAMQFVPHTAFGNTHGRNEREVVDAIPEKLREHGVDMVISGIGA